MGAVSPEKEKESRFSGKPAKKNDMTLTTRAFPKTKKGPLKHPQTGLGVKQKGEEHLAGSWSEVQ